MMSLKKSLLILTASAVIGGSISATVHTASSRTALQEMVKEGMAIVDAYAPWCGPCQRMAPIFEAVSNEFSDVKFIKIDADQNRGIVSSFPTLILYKDGKEVRRAVGFHERGKLKNLVKSTFGL